MKRVALDKKEASQSTVPPSEKPRGAATEGQRVLRTPPAYQNACCSLLGTLLTFGLRSWTPYPLCHCLVGRCLGLSIVASFTKHNSSGRGKCAAARGCLKVSHPPICNSFSFMFRFLRQVPQYTVPIRVSQKRPLIIIAIIIVIIMILLIVTIMLIMLIIMIMLRTIMIVPLERQRLRDRAVCQIRLNKDM